MPYNNRFSSLFASPAASRRARMALASAAGAVALAAGAAATTPGHARPLGSGLPVAVSLRPAGDPLIGHPRAALPGDKAAADLAAVPGGGPAAGRAAAAHAGRGQPPQQQAKATHTAADSGHNAAADHHKSGGHDTRGHDTSGHDAGDSHHSDHGHGNGHDHHAGGDHGHGHHESGSHHGDHGHHGDQGHAGHTAADHQRHAYQMYDSINPSSIPSHRAVAAYSTGRYFATPGQLKRLGQVMWIDITGKDYAASVLDVEPGDATPSQAASWVWHRLHASPHAMVRLYTNRTEWSAVWAAMSWLPHQMRAHVHWWIADPTGAPHNVAGADATQWYWGPNYDISSVQPGF